MKPEGYNLYVEISKCLACHSCELACALEHSRSDDLATAIHEEPRPASRVRVESAGDGMALPLQCRHCEDAPCVTICPTDALHRAGPAMPVLVDETRCIGCKFCVAVCPFGVISMRPEGKAALKCDYCLGRTSEGDNPACVVACKTHAIEFLTLEEIAKRKRQATATAAKQAAKEAAKCVGDK